VAAERLTACPLLRVDGRHCRLASFVVPGSHLEAQVDPSVGAMVERRPAAEGKATDAVGPRDHRAAADLNDVLKPGGVQVSE
jgi:hypothetical protein